MAGVVWQWVWTPRPAVVVDHRWVAEDEGGSLRGGVHRHRHNTSWSGAPPVWSAALVALLLDRTPLLTLLGVVLGSALGAWLMFVVGVALGPSDLTVLARTAEEGTHLPAAWTSPGPARIALPAVRWWRSPSSSSGLRRNAVGADPVP